MAFADIEEDYRDATDDVLRASADTFERALRDWFSVLDADPSVAGRIKALEASVDFENWYAEGEKTQGSFVGSGTLDWARDRSERLGQTLALFRHFARKEDAYVDFSTSFFYAGSRYDEMVSKIVRELFEPFARDLLKGLRRAATEAVPAADRVVTIDHNSPQYADAARQLETLEKAVIQSNELPDPAEKERVVAEISAGRRLLQATKVRFRALVELLSPAFKQIEKWVNGVGSLITIITAAIAGLVMLGLWPF